MTCASTFGPGVRRYFINQHVIVSAWFDLDESYRNERRYVIFVLSSSVIPESPYHTSSDACSFPACCSLDPQPWPCTLYWWLSSMLRTQYHAVFRAKSVPLPGLINVANKDVQVSVLQMLLYVESSIAASANVLWPDVFGRARRYSLSCECLLGLSNRVSL